MSVSQGLVAQLPSRLRNFFAKYPPQIYSAAVAPRPSPPAATTATTPGTTATNNPAAAEGSSPSTTTTSSPLPSSEAASESSSTLPSPYTPDRDAKGFKKPDPTAYSVSKALLYSNPEFPNPFLPRKNFRTGKWFGATIGLRRQAELVKLAAKYNVEELLPPGRKSTAFKEARRAERGLAIKGTGIGQKVKGHKWERTMEARLEERRKAMMEMPEMIRLWKQRGHGRGWKQWPRR